MQKRDQTAPFRFFETICTAAKPLFWYRDNAGTAS